MPKPSLVFSIEKGTSRPRPCVLRKLVPHGRTSCDLYIIATLNSLYYIAIPMYITVLFINIYIIIIYFVPQLLSESISRLEFFNQQYLKLKDSFKARGDQSLDRFYQQNG